MQTLCHGTANTVHQSVMILWTLCVERYDFAHTVHTVLWPQSQTKPSPLWKISILYLASLCPFCFTIHQSIRTFIHQSIHSSILCEMIRYLKKNSQLCSIHWNVFWDLLQSLTWAVHHSPFTWTASGTRTVNKAFTSQTRPELLDTCNQNMMAVSYIT
jgi:hypothetical protein